MSATQDSVVLELVSALMESLEVLYVVLHKDDVLRELSPRVVESAVAAVTAGCECVDELFDRWAEA